MGGRLKLVGLAQEDIVIHNRWAKKEKSISTMSSSLKRLRARVNEDLRSDDEKTFLTALAVYMMLETSERVGNTTSEENGHYGITGLKGKHVKISGPTVTLEYVGKSGVKHKKILNNKKLAEHLTRAKRSSSDNIFETEDGFRIKNDRLNRYLSDFGVTSKDIRGFSANRWILNRLNRVRPEETPEKRTRQYNKVAKEVAEKVGHGAPTLKKHYVPPVQI